MDTLMIVLRVIHIFGGVYWVGASFFMAFLLSPAIKAAGSHGTRTLARLLDATYYATAFPVAAISTTLAGMILYYKISDGFNLDWMESTGGVVLSIGSVAGLLAMGHGGAALGSRTSRAAEMVKNFGLDGPTPQQEAEFLTLMEETDRHTKISLVLMLIALFCMATARYF